MKRIVPALVLIAAGVLGWILWPKGVSDEAIDVEPQSEEASAEEIDSILGLDPDVQDAPTRGDDRRHPRFDELSEEQRAQWRERRQARRLRRRERWQNATPEQRKEWADRRVSVAPLGDQPPQIDSVDVLEAMRDVRPQMRDCIRQNGGFRALRDAMQSADAGARGGMTIAFELSPDGTVTEGSLTMSPAPPGPYFDCFARALQNMDAPVPGGEGAAIEMRMGRRGEGRGRPELPRDESSAVVRENP